MKLKITVLIISIFSASAFAAEYRINEFDTRSKYDRDFLELSLKIESGKGHNLSEIFHLIYVRDDNFSLRILGLPLETRKELNRYYENAMPEKLNAALKSSGNLHNPALEPLKKEFINAFKNTNLYKDLAVILTNKKYVINEISFEKFAIESGVIFVADIWVICKRHV